MNLKKIKDRALKLKDLSPQFDTGKLLDALVRRFPQISEELTKEFSSIIREAFSVSDSLSNAHELVKRVRESAKLKKKGEEYTISSDNYSAEDCKLAESIIYSSSEGQVDIDIVLEGDKVRIKINSYYDNPNYSPSFPLDEF